MSNWQFVLSTLDMGEGEQRARFQEMSERERTAFTALLLAQYEGADLDTQDMLRAVPAAGPYLLPMAVINLHIAPGMLTIIDELAERNGRARWIREACIQYLKA